MPNITIDNLHRGASTEAPFSARVGQVRKAQNIRFESERKLALNRGPTVLVDEISELSSAQTWKFAALGDVLIAVGGGTNPLTVKVFEADGTEGTVTPTAELAFDTGDNNSSDGFRVGDAVTATPGGATAVIVAIKQTGGSFASGDATGTMVLRPTNATAWSAADTINSDVNASTANATGAETDLTYAYLGSDITKIEIVTFGDSVFLLNTDTVVAMEAAPSKTVSGRRGDYNALLKLWTAEVGDVYETKADYLTFPAGFYECVATGTQNDNDPPDWKRIPKPDQPDAVFTASSMMHRLFRVQDDPLIFRFEELQWPPRLSGGDIIGYNETTGRPIIQNDALLKGAKIVSFALFSGPSRGAFATDAGELHLSRSGDYFNLWNNNVSVITADDPLYVPLIVENLGNVIHMEATDESLFIQASNRQIEFGARGETLSAGGEGTPRNGQIREISEFPSSSVRPISVGPYVVMLDASGNLQTYRYDSEARRFQVMPVPISDVIFDDLKDYTVTGLHVVGKTIYVLTIDDGDAETVTDGRAWKFQIQGVNNLGQFRGAWSEMKLDDAFLYVYPNADETRIVTPHDAVHSVLKHLDQAEKPDTGFAYVPALDRRELLTADSYDASRNRTQFTTNTDIVESRTELRVRYNIVIVRFDAGTTAIAAGDTVTGETSDASGVVTRISVSSGDWSTNDAVGSMWIRKLNSKSYVDNENLQVSSVTRAVARADQVEYGSIGQIVKPAAVLVTFNSGGVATLAVGDSIEGATTGATGTVERVTITSGTFAGGDAVGTIALTGVTGGFDSAEDINQVGGQANIATLTSDSKIVEFKDDWSGAQHYVGLSFESFIQLHRLWPGASDDVLLINAFSVFHHLTSDYTVTLIEQGRDDETFPYSSKEIGLTSPSDTPLKTDSFEVLAGAEGIDLDIKIGTSTSGVFKISAVEYDVERFQR